MIIAFGQALSEPDIQAEWRPLGTPAAGQPGSQAAGQPGI